MNAQRHCSYIKIRGPLVVNCNGTGLTGHYYLEDAPSGISGTWSVYPRGDAPVNSALKGNFVAALSILNNFSAQNVIESNRKFVLSLECQKQLAGDETFTQAETDALTTIAWQTAWEGGDAVFEARRLLMLEVDDQEHNLRLAHRTTIFSGRSLNVFPNPSSDNIYISSEPSADSKLRIIDSFGKLILEKRFNSGRTTISDLEAGFYTAQLMDNGRLLNVQKFIIIK